MQGLQYTVHLREPGAHLIFVSLEIPHPDLQGQEISLARWVPGSYLIRELSKHVVAIRAFSGDQPIGLEKLDNSRWRCEPLTTKGTLRIEYEVYAWDYSVRGAHFDTTHAFIDGARIFLQVKGQEETSCQVHMILPEGPHYKKWHIATSMRTAHSKNTFLANHYEELIDHPFEMGIFEELQFTVCDVPHRLVVTGQHYGCLKRLVAELVKICTYQHQLMGTPPDLDRYTFLLSLSASGYGGLEHKMSSACQASRYDMPLAEGAFSKGQMSLLGLLSHEYFHLWNVKRIRPAVLTPYKLHEKSLTRQLWAFEGITAYYDQLFLFRAGVITVEQYLELLEVSMTRLNRTNGQLKQSVTDSSFDAWIKLYQPDENSPNVSISYYTKGSLVALCIDLKIRTLTYQKASLDDVMHLLWAQYGAPGLGVLEGGVEQAVIQVAGPAIKPFLKEWLYETKPLPLKELLDTVGIDLQWRASYQSKDLGGKLSEEKQREWKSAGVLGFSFETKEAYCIVTHVYTGGEAASVGLAVGDRLVAIDNLLFTDSRYEKLQKLIGLNKPVNLHVIRDDRLLCFEVTFREPKLDTIYLKKLDNQSTLWPL